MQTATAAAVAPVAPRVSVYVRPDPKPPAPTGGRALQVRRACSSTWRDDLRHGKDVDYLGRPTGPGTRKVACDACGKAVPPQDVALDAGRRPVCTDCRTRAPREPVARPPAVAVPVVPVMGLPGVTRVAFEQMRPPVTLERDGAGPHAGYRPVVGSLAVAMSPAHVHVLMDRLPTGGAAEPGADADAAEVAAYEADEQALAAELAAFVVGAADPDPEVRAAADAQWRRSSGQAGGEQAWREANYGHGVAGAAE